MMDSRSSQTGTAPNTAEEAVASAMRQAGWTVTDRGLTAPDGSVTIAVRCGLDCIDIRAFQKYDLWPAEDDDPATWQISGPAMPTALIMSIVTAAAVKCPDWDVREVLVPAMASADWRMCTESVRDVLMWESWTSPDGSRELVWLDDKETWFARHAPSAKPWSVTEFATEAVLLALTGVPGVPGVR